MVFNKEEVKMKSLFDILKKPILFFIGSLVIFCALGAIACLISLEIGLSFDYLLSAILFAAIFMVFYVKSGLKAEYDAKKSSQKQITIQKELDNKSLNKCDVTPLNPHYCPEEREQIIISEPKRDFFLSSQGLKPHEILMIYYCDEYTTNQQDFPSFWTYTYGVNRPQKILDKLIDQGFVEVATAKQSLNTLKVSELKEILKSHGLKLSGKKNELIERISQEIEEADLDGYIPEFKYIPTCKGEKELKENEYVIFIHKKGGRAYGLSLYDVNKMCHEYPKHRYKDLIWGHLNQKLMDETQNFVDFGMVRGVALVRQYQYDFLIDEERYTNITLSLLAECVFYDVNETFLYRYKYHLERYAEMMPHHNINEERPEVKRVLYLRIKDFITIQDRMQLTDNEMFSNLVDSFNKCLIKDTIISNTDLAGLIVSEMNDNTELAERVYKDIEKNVVNILKNEIRQ